MKLLLFDDAYQYVTAEENSLILVSFDRDFDKTTRGRQTPQVINQLTSTDNPTS
jgi:predicted nucleic acid-binding protein